MDLISCTIRGVCMKVTEQGAVPTVILETDTGSCIPIYVGLWEALSISNALRGEMLPRPITHDLFPELFGKYAITVQSLQVDSLEDGVFYSRLVLQHNGKEEILDCRPSDGIAIALRVNAPIFVDEEVNRIAGIDKEDLADLKDLSMVL